MRALGLDWSGGQSAHKKIWFAVVEHDALVELGRPFASLRSPGGIAREFAPWLAAQQFDVAGFDFCFGIAAGQAARLGIRATPAALGALLAARFGDDAQAFRVAVGPERRRETDRLRRAPFAPTNLRMFRQTFWGLRALAAVRDPIAPWSKGPRRIHEVLPRLRATALCGGCRYKDGGGSRAERLRLVAALRDRQGLGIAAAQEATLCDDSEGDALDAVFAALEARDARASGETARASAVLSGEGWIYSSPAGVAARDAPAEQLFDALRPDE